tara:strand:+ start:620 stop:1441 length:822 start_codon:yes stop_codon:yes gene_type:complete
MPKKKKTSSKPSTESKYPKITILTPIYNRNKWLPLMIANVYQFDYVKKDLTWLILDSKDGDEDIRLFNSPEEEDNVRKAIYPIKLIYEYIPRKMTIAEKRNYLVKHSPTNWWANMDSDDLYMESYLHYSIDKMKAEKKELCGSKQMVFVYPHHDYQISAIECPSNRQAHEATMVGTQKYFRSMSGFTRNDAKGEGASLIDGNEKNVCMTECAQQMICICHSRNTCNKDLFLDKKCPGAQFSGFKFDLLKDIMKEEVDQGYENLSEFKGAPSAS